MKRLFPLAILGFLVLLAAVALLVSFASSSAQVDRGAAAQHVRHGIALMQEHLYHAAIAEFEAAIRKSPKSLDSWVGLAAVYIRLGNGPKALEGAGQAVSIAESSSDIQLILGRAHWLARNFNDAEQAAFKVQELDPSNRQAAELLLHIYFDRKDEAKFQEVLDRIESPTPQGQDLAVQFALRQGQFRRAYELRNSFDRKTLESRVLRSRLALKREPGRMEFYPPLIKDLVRLGRAGEAITATRQYRGTAQLDLEIGKAHWLAGERDEAVRAYERASSGNTHKLSAEVALAAITGDRRHWIEAFRAEWVQKDYFVLAQLENLLKTASALDKALIYRYAGLYDRELLNSAAQHAVGALRTEPDQFEALMTLGTAYSQLGRIDEAVRYVQQGAERYPERAEVWSRLGQLALARGDSAAAEPLFRKAVLLAPADASDLYNYGWLLDQMDRDSEAGPYYERAIAASSLSFEAMNNLALIEEAAGRSARALDLLNQAVASNPENETAYLNRGIYYATIRSWSNALADYARARELNPLNPIAALESARTHLELDRADIGIQELSEVLDIDPNVREAYVLLSSAYKKQGRESEAAAALEEAKRVEGS